MLEPIQGAFWLASADNPQLLHMSPAFGTICGRPVESGDTYPSGHWNLRVDSIPLSGWERFVAALTLMDKDMGNLFLSFLCCQFTVNKLQLIPLKYAFLQSDEGAIKMDCYANLVNQFYQIIT